MPAPQDVLDLIERFERNKAAYKSGSYNETQVRHEFIDPFFEALGWDINNRQGYAEAYKDVIHEDNVKVGGITKAPDYSFRIGGTRKFFVEAKKPSINIKEDIAPAFQLRRYAWSAKLPLSILTDFEEFAVYDCRIKPDKTDKSSIARTGYYTYQQYAEKWDEIAAIFSREAVLKGSFDQYAGSHKAKKGTAEVDTAFLAEIESWRDLLARNIALRNPTLTTRELNFSVQRTIDRLIFLRICEDRGIEEYGTLRLLSNGVNVYPRLRELYYKADARYNSGLFHFRVEKEVAEAPDKLTLDLVIDDKPLKEILRKLYYPDSPYEFSVLPADILGQVYEQFLGKVIRLTAGHHAVVEDKPEVKKAGGVFYTPTYIVDYIVRNTVGKLLGPVPPPTPSLSKRGLLSSPPVSGVARGGKPMTPVEVTKLRILDPACGSGSFLLGAYQYLLDWHLRWYSENDPTKWAKAKKPALYQGHGGDWRLTTAERKRILLNNIYGVDIDSQAVEVTKLSLLLKVLEGETGESLSKQLSLFHERALPSLANNIKCGNSLIGPDFYDNKQMSLMADEEMYRVNVFDWQREFTEVFKAGGFDAVIGNPPYGLVIDDTHKKYYFEKYNSVEGRVDSFELFIEKGINICKKNNCLSYIIPSPLLSNLYSRRLRKYILDTCGIEEITNFGINVFLDPTVHTSIIILKPGKIHNSILVRKQVNDIIQLTKQYDYKIKQSDFLNNNNYTFDIFLNESLREIINKLASNSELLGNLCYIRQCIKTGNDNIYVNIFETPPEAPWKSTLRGRSITRYGILEQREYLKYGSWLARNWQNKTFYETPKIAIRETGNRIIATIDKESRYFLSSLYAIYPKSSNCKLSLEYLLGMLNSKFATYFIKAIALDLTKGAFSKFRTNQLARFPIRNIDFSSPTDKTRHDRMVQLVEQMLHLQKLLPQAKTDHDKTSIQRQIDATDKQIDKLVYELYGLTEEEIAVVEGT